MILAAADHLEPTASPLLLTLLGIAVGAVLIFFTGERLRRFRRRPVVIALRSLGTFPMLLGLACGAQGFDIVGRSWATAAEPAFLLASAWVALIVGLQARPQLLGRVPALLWRWVVVDLVVAASLSGLASLIIVRTSGLSWSVLFPASLALFVSLAGWNPETRSLRVRFAAPTARLAALVQAGSGLAGLIALSIASLAASGESASPLLRGLFVVSGLLAAAWLILGGATTENQRSIRQFTVLLGLMAFVAGAAPMIGVGPMLLALLLGVAATNVRGPLVALESVAQRLEPLAAWAVHLGAGFYGAVWGGWWWIGLPLALAGCRQLLKPSLMSDALRAAGTDIDRTSPLMHATARPAPLATAFCLTVAIIVPSDLARALLLAIAMTPPLMAVAPLVLASVRRMASSRAHSAEGKAS